MRTFTSVTRGNNMKTIQGLTSLCVATVLLGSISFGGEQVENKATTKAGLTYQPVGKGTRWLVKPDVFIKVLVEKDTYGNGDVEVAELHIPKVPKSEQMVQGLEHTHRSTEIFYVISGKLGHTINGEKHVIEPGQVGIVHAGEKIIHSVEGDEPVKAIVIWVPGGEADNLKNNMGFREQPIGGLLAN